MPRPSKEELQVTMDENAQVVMDYMGMTKEQFSDFLSKLTDKKGRVIDRETWSKLHDEFAANERRITEKNLQGGGIGKALSNVVVLRQFILKK